MYKSKGYRKLGRDAAHRKALLRNLTTELILNGSITTTLPKAKEVQKWAEKTVTIAKKNVDKPMRKRYVQGRLQEVRELVMDEETNQTTPSGERVIKKLYNDIVPMYQDRNGGYTRVIKLGTRRGDNAEMAILELVTQQNK